MNVLLLLPLHLTTCALPFMLRHCRTHATNVFEKQAGGQWAMVLHRGGGHQVDAYPARPHHTSAHPQNGS